MVETIKVKVQPLNAEAFRPYGQVVEGMQMVYPETEEGRVALEMLHFKYRPDAKRTEQFAIHFSYNQTFIPLRGSMVLLVAPPPRNRADGPERYELDYERVAAFLVEPGQAAFIHKGTWHNAVALSPDCTLINITRKNTGEGLSPTTEHAGGRIEHEAAARPYVEFVDLKKRDNRVLELEL